MGRGLPYLGFLDTVSVRCRPLVSLNGGPVGFDDMGGVAVVSELLGH